jgi:CDP-diglyceride synthetase
MDLYLYILFMLMCVAMAADIATSFQGLAAGDPEINPYLTRLGLKPHVAILVTKFGLFAVIGILLWLFGADYGWDIGLAITCAATMLYHGYAVFVNLRRRGRRTK